MEIRLLGAVEFWVGDRQLDLGPRKQRLALGILALNVNKYTPVSRLVDLTWPDSPPRTAEHAIHVRISALRAVLTGARADGVELITRGSTYILRADPLCVDIHRFRALVASARAEALDLDKAALLRRALDLWRGAPLADVATPEMADQLCRGLEEARLAAIEECLEVELRIGRHHELISELTELVAENPFRQRLTATLMLALYRAGRTPDALRAYQLARRRIISEFGIDTGRELRQLEKAILRTDPALDPSTMPTPR
ncbi:DNA-binding SARP family transcriptional activator [Kribbella sp. VKM Ac-2527]|uniref:DNA-binding SARP family transcriptional activator n=1 Tax=Kribbella caucasensis TaxID=2512215 RepID=A0A4R6K729_9ACTN|nr:AfsR/SARP family transcriptional regulator [Kribbella sp. VKM Ac-2527]TDO44372.1 DNA-binding SARP family transcriptional activator [Kribbella sp. VKM Ac-2527]